MLFLEPLREVDGEERQALFKIPLHGAFVSEAAAVIAVQEYGGVVEHAVLVALGQEFVEVVVDPVEAARMIVRVLDVVHEDNVILFAFVDVFEVFDQIEDLFVSFDCADAKIFSLSILSIIEFGYSLP